MIATIADALLRQVETVQDTLGQTFFEPVIRLGVTGLSQSGKTVFITALVANLLDRGRMVHLDTQIEAAFLQPQPSVTVPRFDYERHLDALTGPDPHWPEGTRAVSELRVTLRVRRRGVLGALQGSQRVHLDIIDYPGEWLLDLGLMGQSYADWSRQVLAGLPKRPQAASFLAQVQGTDAAAPLDEVQAQALAQGFAGYLQAARQAGHYDCTPGRFLLPGDLAGSPVLTFAPLPSPQAPARGGLYRQMERRFEAYKSQVVGPFFREHFARIDRQIVLVDALGAIHAGPRAVQELRAAMGAVLAAFRPGQNGILRGLLQGRRVERILFAATKADHIPHSQHAQLTTFMEALLREAADRAGVAGASTKAMAIAALRCTTPEEITHNGQSHAAVRGVLDSNSKQVALYPGALPDSPAAMLRAAQAGAAGWLDQDYDFMRFRPQPNSLRPGMGPPHIRLDRAAEFLIGDRLR